MIFSSCFLIVFALVMNDGQVHTNNCFCKPDPVSINNNNNKIKAYMDLCAIILQLHGVTSK